MRVIKWFILLTLTVVCLLGCGGKKLIKLDDEPLAESKTEIVCELEASDAKN